MSKDNGFVTVGCKLPNGLHLDLKDKSGDAVRVTLNGSNASRIFGGYGLTENVSAEFMTRWLGKNAKHPAVINKQIFVHDDAASAIVIAKEHRELETGLDPIDPVKRGMLNNEAGVVDKKALATYNEAKNNNPARNRQQVE